MHHCLQLLLPAAGLIDIDRDPPRIGALVFEVTTRPNNSVDASGASMVSKIGLRLDKCDDDAASIGLPALPWCPRKLRAAVSAQKRHGQNPRLVKVRRPIRIVGENCHGA